MVGLSIYRPIIYGNTATVLTPKERESLTSTDHTHKWTVAVRSAASPADSDQVGGADDIGHFIKRVTFKLHDTYSNPSRNIDKPPFEVSETGWGEFEIQIRITFIPESGEKAMTLYHHLKLHPWAASAHPPTPLPKSKRRPVPFHLAHPGSLEASKGGTPEFTALMEKEEAERLEEARKAVLAEQDRWRATLAEKEKELERLQKQAGT
ncbi:yeats family-domain-containing protein [Infundibulicybe gibba]|nr:yeats family-domain-containing protein [Infundibulicybe gibba]